MSASAMFWRKLCLIPNVRGARSLTGSETLCLLLCFVFSSVGSSAAANSGIVSCSNVKNIFESRSVTILDNLEEPITGGTCGVSCCSPSTSTYLAATARREMETMMKNQANRVATSLQSSAKRFDEVFRALLAHSKQEFHSMFTRTYGLIYERHAHLFADLFSDLERYYVVGDLDLAKAMDEFFAVLYQKMFVVLNSQYHFDDKYLTCVSQHMRELQPFGDVPPKLVVQVKRAFVATRTFTKALVMASYVARNMANTRGQSQTCAPLVVRARFCGACSGASEKACPNLCLNSARACLPLYADLSPDWDAFVDTMDKVSDRLLNSFNIAVVVEPIDIKISEAIMNFQEHSPELSETVFSGCGKPVLGQHPADTAYFPAGARMTRSVNFPSIYTDTKKRSADNNDDFEIETSEESLLKKNPFILSRGSSRKQLLPENEKNIDAKSQNSINENVDTNNDLVNEDDSFANSKNFDKRMAYDRLVSGSRTRRDADPEPGKSSKEIEFEVYDFNSESPRGGGRRRGNKKQGGGKRKKTEDQVLPEVNEGDNSHENNDSKYGNSLNNMVREARQRVRETRKIWSRLPQMYCDTISAPESDEKCWNGTHVAKYLPPLAGEGSAALATNPELRGSSSSSISSVSSPAISVLTTQQLNLRKIISKLKNAYNGLDVDWGEGEDSSSLTFGSGSGSGDGTDDDDDYAEVGGPPDQEEGSGHQVPEEPKFENKEPDQDLTEENEPYNPPVVIKNDLDTGIIDEEEDNNIDVDQNRIDNDKDLSSTSGVEQKEEMSLQRAMITYLFPIVCVWFGGIITDIA